MKKTPLTSSVFKAIRRTIMCTLLLGVFCVYIGMMNRPVAAVTGVNKQMNFQGRLLNAQGAVVPDGFYNIEFKIYQDGTGAATGNPGGTLKWTESWLNQAGKGVQVKNGFMSVQLGSISPFGSQIDWDQDTLWLSINIGNTSTTCTPFTACGGDGEMVPMKRLSAVAYAMNATMLGGKTAADFIQNTTAVQNANIAIQSANAANVGMVIQGAVAQTANLLDLKTDTGAAVASFSATGAVQLQNTADSVAALSLKNAAGASLLTADTQNMRIGIGTSVPQTTLHVETNNNLTDQMQLLVKQSGSGDAGVELSANNQSFYMGVDNSDSTSFKISSSAASGSTSVAGNNTVFTNVDAGIKDVISFTRFVPTATGSISQVNVFVGPTGSATNNMGLAGVYNDQGAHPYQRLAMSAQQTLNANSWNTFNLSSAINVTAGQTYWFAYTAGGVSPTASDNNPVYQPGAPANSSCYLNNGYNGTMPASVLSCSSTSVYYSYYATVSSSSGSNDPLGSGLFRLSSTGQTIFKNSLNSSLAFQVQNAAGTNVLNVDTSTSRVSISQLASETAAYDLSFGGSSDRVIGINQSPTLGSGKQLTVRAGNGNSGNGGALVLQGGNAGGTGNANGGNITLSGGAGVGTGASGLVVMTTPTYQTTQNDANCYSGGAAVASSCTITLNSINNTSAIIVGFSADGMTATMPDPTITTAGRVIYVTAANGSKDFTLSVNAGGQGNQIAMRQNTTATMIWNGNDWTAAGASSSTTLQAAYDNTLQSAGGAELVVSKTGATNGLTIRDSATNPVNGTLLTVQTQSAAGLISVNSNVTEYATNAGAETAGANVTSFPANTWSANAGATVSRNSVAGNTIATGQGSVKIVTPATANSGVKNQLSSSLGANTTYNVSFATRLESGTFTDLSIYYSVNGTALSVPCAVNESAVTSVWKKINCTFTTPSTGITTSNAIMIVQASAAAHTFYVDNLSVTIAADYNFATDGNVNDDTNFSTNWSNAGPGAVAVTRDTTDGYNASDSARANITTGAANAGIRNRLSSSPLPSTLYRITVYAKAASTFADFKVRYSPNGGTNYTDCVDYNTQNVSTTNWTKITCYIQTPATATTTPYVYFAETSSAVRSFSVDAFNMSISTITTPNVQVGGGVNGGPTTLFTLDKGASAPIASDNDALLGSMYYDTTLGKLQCYEADGWGACGSSPDNIITISPEYTNAVLHGTGIGTMTSDICSSTLGINDGSNGQQTICGSGETYNFYKWTSPQASAQLYSIYVTYQLPATFKEFNSGQTSLMARSNNGSNGGTASVDYQVYRNAASSGLTPCGSSNSVSSGTVTSWQTKMANGAADPSTCGFAPGDSIVFKITVSASRNATAYVGNLNFAFSNR